MIVFKQYFKDDVFDGKEVAVRCPFPHYDENGNQYLEENPSAHINTDKATLHCKVCGEGYSETKFLAKLNGISYRDAKKLIAEIEKDKGNHVWNDEVENLWKSEDALKFPHSLGISNDTLKELKVGYQGAGLSFPVFMYGELLDVRLYNPSNKDIGLPKVMSRKGAPTGLIIPFDIWIDDERPTLLCAGEKDMALARTLGYNAITVTGGENAFPKLFKASFRGKKLYIAYDNDEAGKNGAKKLATMFKEVGAIPYVVTGHHEVANQKGEDFHDYIMKYGMTKEDFDKVLENTPEFSETDYQEEKEKIIPSVKLIDATQGKYRNKFVRSSVQVTATFDQAFGIADFVEVVKTADDDKGTMDKDDKREWSLDDENLQDILLLMDSKLRDKDVESNLKKLCGIPSNEKFLSIRKYSHDTVFKAVVTDLVESDVMKKDYQAPHETTVYTIGRKLQSGMKYKLTYKLVPHPLQNQEMVALVTDIEESGDSVSLFKVTDEVKESLKVFQGEPKVKMQEIYERAKGIIGSFAQEQITFATDLVYHTPLAFDFGRHELRGALDVMIVGESRTGKSATAEALLRTYELGTFSTLKNSSVAGLVGGSNKVNGSFKTMVGTIPRNHKGLVVFEEFSGADPNFIKAITDIRSSGMVRLTRVNGELVLPATLRMLTISNQKTVHEGFSKPLRNYPNGVSVLVELIGASEDIARYDFFVLAGEPDEYEDPLAFVDEPFATESYQNRVRWVWSRTKEQVKFAEGVERYIVDRASALNKEYKSHIKFFGSEAYKKLARISVATASCLVSTDETFENIIITKEHVDWAAAFLVSLYDNDLFRLRQFVEEQNRYTEIDEECVHGVQLLFNNNATLLTQMEMTPSMSSRNLQAISGLESKDFTVVMNDMAKMYLFQWQGDKIVPSARFRKAMSKINRATEVKKIGIL